MPSKFAAEGAKLLKLGLLDDAAEQFDKGIRAEPQDAECLLGLSRCRLAQRRLPEAKALLQQLDALKPNVPEVHVHLARIAFEEGDRQQVNKLRALAARKDAGFPELYNLGLTLLDLGELDEAGQAFRLASKAMPDSPYPYFNLGLVMRRKGDLDRALKAFKMARELAPTEVQPYLQLVSTWVEKGELATAATALTKAIKELPEAWQLYEEMVKVSLFANAPKQAVRAAIELRSRRPKDPNAAYLHALALTVAGDLDHARAVLKDALELAPGHWQLTFALGKLAWTQKDNAAAQKLFEEAMAKAPSEPGPPTDLSTLLLSQDQVDAARAVLAQALAAHPDDPGLNLNQAILLQKTGGKEVAAHAQKALGSKDPGARAQAQRLLELAAAPAKPAPKA